MPECAPQLGSDEVRQFPGLRKHAAENVEGMEHTVDSMSADRHTGLGQALCEVFRLVSKDIAFGRAHGGRGQTANRVSR